ncbi:NUDIX hydrolase N-terminal domain-containing protein [Deinococcus sp. KNUC1210]|uniref:NUDIX hydrolase N-terminal domain-containing protein n=1 Tax=Deinococcus sp. KNUC1210 TaxID=2917691 RepID=UPI001EF04068|nr:NUDIX hydrolase N-terminal domain-containing protein [Deinococcus sp. KNUC1210]ULH14680.1 NUDIX hydrolase N-terminal domain-containing protein [Deinococcus sp. KNUC1210]
MSGDAPELGQRLAQIADELRSHANLGLLYVQDSHDLARYRRILELSAELASLPVPDGEPLTLPLTRTAYLNNLTHIGPLLRAEALVRRGERVLLMRRADNGLWGLPGGLVEVGETLAEAATRELYEETGMAGQATRLLLVSDTHADGGSPLHIVTATFLFEAGGEPQPTLEASEVGWFAPGEWPALHDGHPVRLERALRALATQETLFDSAPPFHHPAQARSAAGQPPVFSPEVEQAQKLLRTVLFGTLGRQGDRSTSS